MTSQKLIGVLNDKSGVKINFPALVAKNPKFAIKKFRASMSTKQQLAESSKGAFKKNKFVIAAKTLKAFTTTGDNLFITRIAAGALYDADIIDGLSCNVLDGSDLKLVDGDFECDLIDYQVEMIEKITAGDENWLPHKSLSYASMPTGSGKTIVGCGLIAERKKSTFVVVPTKEIAGQWIEDLHRTLPKLTVCLVTKKILDADELKKYDIAVCVINTARRLEHFDVKYFGQILLDEVHEYYSPVNVKVLWLAQCFKFGVGFSATPSERADKLDTHVFKFLGMPIECNIEMPKYKFHVHITDYYGGLEFCQPVVNNGVLCATTTIEKLAKEPVRIDLICSIARTLVAAGKSIFIFAEHRELLPIYRNRLLELFRESKDDMSNDIECPEMGILRGGVTNLEAKEAREAKIVLTTYGYSRRGISIREKTAIVFATPRRSPLAQIFGRVTRRGGPSVDVIREVHYICDARSPIKGQVKSIRDFAKDKGYNVTKSKVYGESNSKNKNDDTGGDEENDE